ncbi:17343_t:CDS:2 [Gigaspora margarita]|uniref:17343_t:CDS:1 n=1 Tax=Gigaspora margarita TaxID=4874 RepID=A0ABN7UZ44_GIGMA|nr:17343_t:CDS:2 [Gigaspora margarita]
MLQISKSARFCPCQIRSDDIRDAKVNDENASKGPVGTDSFGGMVYQQVISGKESWNSKGMGCLINMRSLMLEKQVEIAKKRKTRRNSKYVPDISLVNGEDPKDLDRVLMNKKNKK